MMLRRSFVAGLGVLPVLAPARVPVLPPECHWLLGSWRSDMEMSMEHFTYKGQRPGADVLPRVANLFGKMTHIYTPTRFVVEYRIETKVDRVETAYWVERLTPSSVSLRFPEAPGLTDTTLYRGDGYYFSRVGDNFEYFRKMPA